MKKRVSNRFWKTCKMMVEGLHPQPKAKLVGCVGDEIQEPGEKLEQKKGYLDDRPNEWNLKHAKMDER